VCVWLFEVCVSFLVLKTACLLDATYAEAELMPVKIVEKSESIELPECSAVVHFPNVFRHLRVQTFALPLVDSIGNRGMFELVSRAFFKKRCCFPNLTQFSQQV
jgi:hypothetical protein